MKTKPLSLSGLTRQSLFLIALILISFLFTSCLADILNKELGYAPPVYITYRTEKGEEPSRIRHPSNEPLTQNELPVLSEQGWIFGGWYLDIQYTTLVTEGTLLTENTKLFAKWIPRTDTPFVIKNYFLDVTTGSTTFIHRSDKDQHLTGTTDEWFNFSNYNLCYDSSDSQLADFELIGDNITEDQNNIENHTIKADGSSVFYCYYYKSHLDAQYFPALVNALPNINKQYIVYITQEDTSNPPDLYYNISYVLTQKVIDYGYDYNPNGENVLLYKPTFYLDLTNTTITSITTGTFMYCHPIYSVYIPGTVTNIGVDAFKGCKRLNLVWLSSESGKSWYYTDEENIEHPIGNPMVPEFTATILRDNGYELNQH